MPVVLRTRASTVGVLLVVVAVAVPLVGADEDGPPPPWWVVPLVGAAVLLAVARTRVEIGPVRVRVVGLGPAVELVRQRIVAVHAGGGRNRPAFVALDDGTTAKVPLLLSSERLADALGVPHLSWAGDREVSRPRLSRWVVVVAGVLVALSLGMVVFFMLRGPDR